MITVTIDSKTDTSENGHLELVPAFLDWLCLTLSKMDNGAVEVLLGISGGVQPGFPNLDPISDQTM